MIGEQWDGVGVRRGGDCVCVGVGRSLKGRVGGEVCERVWFGWGEAGLGEGRLVLMAAGVEGGGLRLSGGWIWDNDVM